MQINYAFLISLNPVVILFQLLSLLSCVFCKLLTVCPHCNSLFNYVLNHGNIKNA